MRIIERIIRIQTFLTFSIPSTGLLCLFLCLVSDHAMATLEIKNSKGSSSLQTSYAKRKIREFSDLNPSVFINGVTIISISKDSILGKDAFRLEKNGTNIQIAGGDGNGIIYGCIELIEQLRTKRRVDLITPVSSKPAVSFRAIKFNMPFNPYRTHESLLQHQETCKDLKFWERFLDMMTENRYNVLSLWSLHPFHYMVKLKQYPEASSFSNSEMAEWRKFWTSLFHMAKERGIETYLMSWTIFVSPRLAEVHHLPDYHQSGAYIGDGDTSKIAEQYTRATIRQVIDEYPELTGLGITIGERMGGFDPDQRRAWLDRTVFAGMKDAKRKIKFIYRAPLSANTKSGGSTSEENDLKTRQQIERINAISPVGLEFKYNWSHGHSSPNLFIVHGGKLSDKYYNPLPEKYKYIWTLRNEDFFVLRWGESGFIREFLNNNTRQPYVWGCFLGSEVFYPALDYISKPGDYRNWDYHFERLWLWYKMWGRLMYDPKTPDSLFSGALSYRFGENIGTDLLKAWQLASKVPLYFSSYHQGRSDATLYTEGFCSWKADATPVLFDIYNIINHPVLDTLRFVNIHDYLANTRVAKGIISPLALADSLESITARTTNLLATIREKKSISVTLECELADIEAWGWYAYYFADKLRAGVEFAKFLNSKDEAHRKVALAHLENGVFHWKKYAETVGRYNKPFIFYSDQPFSVANLLPQVLKDIEIVQNAK